MEEISRSEAIEGVEWETRVRFFLPKVFFFLIFVLMKLCAWEEMIFPYFEESITLIFRKFSPKLSKTAVGKLKKLENVFLKIVPAFWWHTNWFLERQKMGLAQGPHDGANGSERQHALITQLSRLNWQLTEQLVKEREESETAKKEHETEKKHLIDLMITINKKAGESSTAAMEFFS